MSRSIRRWLKWILMCKDSKWINVLQWNSWYLIAVDGICGSVDFLFTQRKFFRRRARCGGGVRDARAAPMPTLSTTVSSRWVTYTHTTHPSSHQRLRLFHTGDFPTPLSPHKLKRFSTIKSSLDIFNTIDVRILNWYLPCSGRFKYNSF